MRPLAPGQRLSRQALRVWKDREIAAYHAAQDDWARRLLTRRPRSKGLIRPESRSRAPQRVSRDRPFSGAWRTESTGWAAMHRNFRSKAERDNIIFHPCPGLSGRVWRTYAR